MAARPDQIGGPPAGLIRYTVPGSSRMIATTGACHARQMNVHYHHGGRCHDLIPDAMRIAVRADDRIGVPLILASTPYQDHAGAVWEARSVDMFAILYEARPRNVRAELAEVLRDFDAADPLDLMTNHVATRCRRRVRCGGLDRRCYEGRERCDGHDRSKRRRSRGRTGEIRSDPGVPGRRRHERNPGSHKTTDRGGATPVLGPLRRRTAPRRRAPHAPGRPLPPGFFATQAAHAGRR